MNDRAQTTTAQDLQPGTRVRILPGTSPSLSGTATVLTVRPDGDIEVELDQRAYGASDWWVHRRFVEVIR